MKYYHFNFPGQALGGQAIVKAHSEEEARAELAVLYGWIKPELFTVECANQVRKGVEVIFNWDGDY